MMIYDWGTRRDALAFKLWPIARILPANPSDTAAGLLAAGDVTLRPGEVFLFHLNVTQSGTWLGGRSALLHRIECSGARCWNGEIGDVSKRHIQRLNGLLGLPTVEATPSLPPATSVIIKTNLNYGGLGERRLGAEQRASLGLAAGDSRIDRFDRYEICEIADVPAEDWDDPHLVIERYICNARNIYFRCYLAGNRIVLSEAVNPNRIKKMLPGLPRSNKCFDASRLATKEPFGRILRHCIRFRNALRLDYGALDIVMDDDGTPYIIDANPTPGWGDERQEEVIAHLSGAERLDDIQYKACPDQ